MKTFLFITTLTPQKKLSPLRADLFQLYLKALTAQTYPNWNALLVGEENRIEGKFIYVKSDAISKMEKLKVAYEYILQLKDKPDFIIRLDDDDLISPSVLEEASKVDFDCYADEYHTYYDITACKTCQNIRPWLANTIIHKYEHALSSFGSDALPLFIQDHSKKWHVFYKNKKIHFATKKHPVYMRIISPTTITSKINQNLKDGAEDFDKDAYEYYLNSFGRWRNFNCDDFKSYKNDLIAFWESFSKKKIKIKFNLMDLFTP